LLAWYVMLRLFRWFMVSLAVVHKPEKLRLLLPLPWLRVAQIYPKDLP